MLRLQENKEFPEKESVLNLYESGKWFNKKTLAKQPFKRQANHSKQAMLH
jgi:hypothetical protein